MVYVIKFSKRNIQYIVTLLWLRERQDNKPLLKNLKPNIIVIPNHNQSCSACKSFSKFFLSGQGLWQLGEQSCSLQTARAAGGLLLGTRPLSLVASLDNLSRMGLILTLTWLLTWASFPPRRDLVTATLTPENWTEKGRLRKGRGEVGRINELISTRLLTPWNEKQPGRANTMSFIQTTFPSSHLSCKSPQQLHSISSYK